MDRYPLNGRTVFITGGANGIGAETARQAAKRGAHLAIVDIDGDAAKRLAAELPAAIGLQADVRDMDSLDAAVARTIDAFGGIDVALANAGIGTIGTAESMPIDEIERIADINFTGVLRTVRATLPHIVERRGYLLITASLAAIMHTPPLTHYSATKAGVEAFGNAVRIEVADRGVDVGVAYFGFIDTDMVTQGNENPAVAAWRATHPRAQRGPLAKTYPVSGAGAAVVRGIETRARRVMYPRFLRVFQALRAITPRISEKALASQDVGDVVGALNKLATDSPAKAEAALAEQLSLGASD
jgi:NAD(P)-dependent dehydrogenase (short-subunit alcohol dehydrogenase family)